MPLKARGAITDARQLQSRQKDGPIITAITYRVGNPAQGLKTSLEYVGFIVKGLRERGVCEDYIDDVKKMAQANNPAIADQVQGL